MAAEEVDDLVFQAPPAKRLRLNTADEINPAVEIEDMETFYSTEDKTPVSTSVFQTPLETNPPLQTTSPAQFGIPGLGRLGYAPKSGDVVGKVLIDQDVNRKPAEIPADLTVYPDTDMTGIDMHRAEVIDPTNISSSTESPPSKAIADPGRSVSHVITTLQPSIENPKDVEGVIKNGVWEDVKTENSGSVILDSIGRRHVSENETAVSKIGNDEMNLETSKPLCISTMPTSAHKISQEIEDAGLALPVSILPQTITAETETEKTNATEGSSSPPLTQALVALLGGLESPAVLPPVPGNAPIVEETPPDDEHPEWEVDSSPIESSSDDSSSDDSSSDEDSDDDHPYKLLSPEEQARILMEGDGGSDDEGDSKGAKGPGGQIRTKNEIPDEVIPKPDVSITSGMAIEELGAVEAIVESILLIKAKTSGEYRVLESGSVLCLADRSVIGVVSETLGRVQQPLYSVRFTNTGEITEAGLSVGTKVFYSEQHSRYVFTQTLKAYKGSDASNLHDEEVGDEEIEFSDDEAEMEHRRRLKQKKLEKRGGKMQYNGGSSRGGHPLQQQFSPGGGKALSYDDAEDDGPYKPLTRPAGFADIVGRSEAPQEGAYLGGMDRPNYAGRNDPNRDQFRGRGRGDRGRGRGDRGRGRGGHQDRREGIGSSMPSQGHQNGGYAPPMQSPGANFSQSPLHSPQGRAFPHPPQGPPVVPPNNFYTPQQDQYSPQHPQMWPQYPQHPFGQQFAQGFPNIPNGWPNMGPASPLPSGAFINPAFFPGNQAGAPNQWNQQGQQGGRGTDRSQ